MDSLIAVHDFLAEFLNLHLVHASDLIVALFISLFEGLESLLEDEEVTGEFFVLLCQFLVEGLSFSTHFFKFLLSVTHLLALLSLLSPQLVNSLSGVSLSILKDGEVETKLLLVEVVNSLHLLHALLECLHLLLQSDLGACLLVSLHGFEVLELGHVLLFSLLFLDLVLFLHLLVVVEQSLDLRLVSSQNVLSFVLEGFLDELEVVLIILSSVRVLASHTLNKYIDIVTLLSSGLNVLVLLF